MTITFENDNDGIIYPFEKIFTFARDNQYLSWAQRVWWISWIIGLQQGLIMRIDNLAKRRIIRNTELQSNSPIHPELQDIQGKELPDINNTSH
jgi:hypothetical protein